MPLFSPFRLTTSLAVIAAGCAALAFGSGASAQPPTKVDDVTSLSRHLYSLAPPLAHPPIVDVDTTDFPQGKEWAEKAQQVVTDWFPQVWQMLGTEGQTPPKRIHLVFKHTLEVPAYASGDTLTINGEWITKQPNDFGMMVHELTHLIQAYWNNKGEKPGWLVEGIADYIRWWRYEPESPRTPINPARASYRDSYRTTGAFLAFVSARYDRGLVPRLDRALRNGTYSNFLFVEASAGKDLDALWAEFLVKGGPSYGLPAANAITMALPVPPETWQEHWFEHKQLVKRVTYNDDIAVYADDDTNWAQIEAMVPVLTQMWRYTKATYGAFGPEGRLYYVFHQGKYSGGHPSTYFDASHDFRNVSDAGPGPWGLTALDIPSHEVGHVVEGASNGVHGSPAFPIWGDSKWAEFYQYDLYKGIGREADAQRLYDKFIKGTDNFPQPGTHWFKDWFFPLWQKDGGSKVMVNFFALTTKNFPTEGENDGKNRKFSRDMNWGEYVHFMSGAAHADLSQMADKAFGPSAERTAQIAKARADFPGVTYPVAK